MLVESEPVRSTSVTFSYSSTRTDVYNSYLYPYLEVLYVIIISSKFQNIKLWKISFSSFLR